MAHDMGLFECLACGKEILRKRWKQKYCSTSCRVNDWQRRTGYRAKRVSIAGRSRVTVTTSSPSRIKNET